MPILIFILISTSVPTIAEAKYISSIGGSGVDDGEFNLPTGLVIDNNRILVSDYFNNRIQIFDMAGNFLFNFGEAGSNPGQFNSPNGIDVNETHIFVADFWNHRIQIFDKDGNFEDEFGSNGVLAGEFDRPRSVKVIDDLIYVADVFNNRIQVFNLDGSWNNTIGSFGTVNGRFDNPNSLDVNNGLIYVTDTGNNRIQIIKENEAFHAKYNVSGPGPGELNIPFYIKIRNNHIFVAELNGHRVQVFDKAFNFVGVIEEIGRNPQDIEVNDTHIFIAENDFDQIHIYQIIPIPSNFHAQKSKSGVFLSWDLSVEGGISKVDFYQVYRKNGTHPFEKLAETSDPFFRDDTTIAGNTYQYKIKAVGGLGESPFSNIVTFSDTGLSGEITITEYVTDEGTSLVETVTTSIDETTTVTSLPVPFPFIPFVGMLVIMLRILSKRTLKMKD